MLTGGCYCGAIRYETSAAATHQALCHCTICRRTTGAPCVAWFTVPADSYRLLSGTPTSFRSSQHGTRSFCSICGTQLTFADADFPAEVDITSASLDQPSLAPPQSHIFVADAIPWLVLGDRLPRYTASRSQG
ncbi:MAG: GFA family protein [Pseudomonadota bacterium]